MALIGVAGCSGGPAAEPEVVTETVTVEAEPAAESEPTQTEEHGPAETPEPEPEPELLSEHVPDDEYDADLDVPRRRSASRRDLYMDSPLDSTYEGDRLGQLGRVDPRQSDDADDIAGKIAPIALQIMWEGMKSGEQGDIHFG